jgi:UPF0755 protein
MLRFRGFILMLFSAFIFGTLFVFSVISKGFYKLNRKIKKLAPLWAIILLALATFIAILAVQVFSKPTKLDFSETVSVMIPKGAGLRQMADLLDKESLIESEWLFVAVARVTGLDRRLRAGRYTFDKPMSLYETINALTVGGSFDVMVTFPEGKNVWEVAQIASDSLGVPPDSFLELCFNKAFLDSLKIPGPSCEGYLFPETYSLPQGISARELIMRMFAQFKILWTDSLQKRADVLKMKQNEIITLASIVEGEAHVKWEQGIISSVYQNRLRIGMLLQADPTVIYGLRCFGRELTKEDLDTSNSKYNTYRFYGLPPGPINNPGRGAILSALYPDSTGYYFFVSNEDGTHWFNVTLESHYSAIHSIRDAGKHGPKPVTFNRKLLNE